MRTTSPPIEEPCDRVARYVQVARDLLDRFALDQMLSRIGRSSPQSASPRLLQIEAGRPIGQNSGGQFWTPIPRLRGSKCTPKHHLPRHPASLSRHRCCAGRGVSARSRGIGALNYQSVASISSTGSMARRRRSPADGAPILHTNIRGSRYYIEENDVAAAFPRSIDCTSSVWRAWPRALRELSANPEKQGSRPHGVARHPARA